jgi:2-polyprenyl-3-methyl-5-hydroxy-6-metoxy-1,4-benzoquinol methylase
MDKQTEKELLKIVKKNYKEIANEFNNTRKRKPENLWSGLIEISKNIKNTESVLDVGCGNGRLIDIIGNKKINYLGIDNCSKIIKIAKKNYPEKKFKTADILDLGSLKELNFDYVFLNAVLHHIPGKKLRIQALKQLKNKINKDGKIIITVWNLWNGNSKKNFKKLIIKFFFLKLLKKNNMDFGDIIFPGFKNKSKRYYHAFTKRSLKKIFKKAGLKIEKIYKDKHNYYAILTK